MGNWPIWPSEVDQIQCGNVDFTCAMIWPWLSSLGVVGAVNWDWVGLRRGGTEVSNNSPRPDSPGYPITLFCLFPDTTIWDYLVHCTLTYSLSFPLNTHTHTPWSSGFLWNRALEMLSGWVKNTQHSKSAANIYTLLRHLCLMENLCLKSIQTCTTFKQTIT